MRQEETVAVESRGGVRAPEERTAVRRLWRVWAAAIALGFAAYLFHGYDADELQHLHIAWRIGQGDLPYRDFFEHHPPLLYLLIASLFRSFSEADLTVLLLARAIALGVTLITLALLYRLVRRMVSPMTACIGIGAMIALPVFGRSAMELRPDGPGLLAVSGAVLILASGMLPGKMAGGRAAVIAGALIGTACCFTQKALVPLVGVAGWMGAVLLFAPPQREERRRRIAALLAFIAGAGLTIGACALLFAALGAGGVFWQHVIAINLRWKRIAPGWHCMPETLLLCFPVFVFALTALLQMLKGGRALLRDAAPETLPGALLLAGIAGQFATPIPTWQSVLVFLAPWAVCLFSLQIARLAQKPGLLSADRLWMLAASALVLSAMTWLNTLLGAVVWSVIGWIAWRFWQRAGNAQARLSCLMAMSLTPGLIFRIGFSADQFYKREFAEQMRMMRYLQAHVAPGEPVLQPWPVLLPFRPAATHRWFATLDTLNSLASPAMEAEYIAAVESGKARLVVVNPRHMERFLPRFARYLQTQCRLLRDAPATRDALRVYERSSARGTPTEGRRRRILNVL